MQMLNLYFAPFALVLIFTAVYFQVENPMDLKHWDQSYKFALAILAAAMVVNWWLAANTYRFIRWTRQIRALQAWMYYLWAIPLFYLLVPFWGPTWLLFAMAPINAALSMTFWPALGASVVSAGTMLLIYNVRMPLEGATLGMACVHASFIVILSMFVHKLAQNELRMRDVGRS